MGAIDWSQLQGGQQSAGQGGAIDWSQVNAAPSAAPAAPAASAPVAEKQQSSGLGSYLYNNMVQPYVDLGKGAYRGLQNVTDTLLQGGSTVLDKVAGTSTRPTVDAAIKTNRANYEAGVKNPTWAKVGEIGGEIGGTLPFAPEAGAEYLAAKLGPTAANALGKIPGLMRVANGAIQGGTQAALTSSTSDAPLTQQIGTGAAFGAAAAPVASGIARVMSPKGPSAEVQQLLDAGVTPTPGQMAGGFVNTVEQKLSSMPVVGNMINAARGRAVDDFNVAVANRALAPIGATVPKDIKAGSDLVEHVANKIGSVYDSVQPKAMFAADPAFNTAVTDIRTQLAQTAPAKLDQFENILKNQITGKLKNGVMDGNQWGDTRSMLGSFVRQNSAGNATVDERALASAVGDLRDAVNGAVYRASPADVQPAIEKANTAWVQYKQMERAAGTVGAFNRGNVFSPAQYTAAVRKDLSAGQRARGEGMNAEFAQNAQQVLGNSVPDSGTAGRLGEAGLLGALVTHPSALLNPSLYAAAVPALAYTKPGQALMAAAMQARPGMAPAASVVRRAGPMAAGLLGNGQDQPQPVMPEDPYLLGQ